MKIEIEELEYDRLKSREEKLMAYYGWFVDKENDLATVEDIVNKNIELRNENKKLNEFKTKREESMFYFKVQMERAEPKTAREAEDLQKAKAIFEGLYREELSCLEEENIKLKEDLLHYIRREEEYREEIKFLEQCLDNKEKVNKSLREDLKIWKLTAKDYAKQCWVDLDDDLNI